MLYRFRNILGITILVAGVLLVGIALYDAWQAFLLTCPNKDVLSWDANLRLRTVIDIYHDIKSGNIFSPFLHTMRSPTWPALRSNIALLTFMIHPAGPDTILDVSISFTFYILLFISIFFIAWDMSRDFFRASVIWFFCAQLILYTRHFTVYALSSMLETQGMFFMLLTAYFIYKVYEQQRMLRFLRLSGSIVELQQRRRYWIGLFICAQGLFHTKYPYGLMLLIALTIYEFVRQPLPFFGFVQFSFRQHYKGTRRIILYVIAGIGLVFVGLILLAKLNIGWVPVEAMRSKVVRNVLWLMSLLIFIDLNVYIFKYRFELGRLFDPAFRQIYLAVLAPISLWLLLHPDRLGSIVGTQQHEQEASRSFSESLLFDVFDRSEPLYLVLIGAGLGLLVFLWVLYRGLSFRRSLIEACKHPLVAVAAIFILQFLTLEKLTGNKQLRHIFHLVPAILLIASVIMVRLPHLLGFTKSRFTTTTFILSRIGYLLLPLSLLVFYLPTKPIKGQPNEEKTKSDSVLPIINYTKGRWLCFTDYNPEIYKPVRELVAQVDNSQNYILFNTLHTLPDLDTRRVYATEFDVLLRMRLLKNDKQLRNSEHYTKLAWTDYDKILLITPDCKEQPYIQVLNKAANQQKMILSKQKIMHTPKSNMCLRSFKLQSK